MKRIAILFLLVTGLNHQVLGTEGMWIPSLIDMFYSDMKTYGLKLTAEQIYSTNETSLKDAVIQFNGGCTAEIVSDKGLILTNHHCGFDAIQKHTTLEHNYLEDGFWSKNHAEELACPWLRVTFVKRIEEVTTQVLSGVKADMSIEVRNTLIRKNIASIEKTAMTGSSLKAKIKSFNLGNQYFMLVTEDFNDIRLVGTPPSAIGKFGGDTDNWIWPRHTGDFSVFRIYADENNKSAKYNENNKPYNPRHVLPISMKPKRKGDFTLVYGFPGSTDQHYSKRKLKFYIEKERPTRIKMRQATLDIIKPAMNADDLIKIQYASKQARLSNAWKKWIGQVKGLRELDALGKKGNWESIYLAKASERNEWKAKYYPVVESLAKLQDENEALEMAYAMFVEYFYYGPEFVKFSESFKNLILNTEELKTSNKLEAEIEKMKRKTTSFFKNYNQEIDHKVFKKLTPMYLSNVSNELLLDRLKTDWQKRGELIFKKSVFLNQEKLESYLNDFGKKAKKKLMKDPAFLFSRDVMNGYRQNVLQKLRLFFAQEDELMQTYLEGIMVMFPDKKTWPDANSTMRLTYGKIDGSSPYDGMSYSHYTTIKGIMQKYDKENPDFQLPERFIELYNKKDFGNYLQDEELWVCFTSSNHTTGGNSGSPVIDGEGNLMGINFDRSWESTMSDFLFDESRCRNITVDIRYVLWVIDKYGNAPHLISEMKLVF